MMSYLLGAYWIVLPLIKVGLSYDVFEYPKVVFFVISINIILSIKLWLEKDRFGELFKLNSIDKLLGLWFLLQILSWGVNNFPSVSFWGQYYRYEGLVTIFGYLEFYFLISRFGEIKIIEKFVAIGGGLTMVYVLISGILFNFFKMPVYTFNGRAAGTFGNPNFAAGFLALSFAFVLYHKKWKNWIKILLSLLFLVALVFTQSRSGILGYLLVLLLYLTQRYKYNLLLILPTGLIGLLILINIFPRYSPFSNQLTIWQKGIVAIEQRPWVGYGVERFEVGFQKTLIKNRDFDLLNIRVDKAHNEIIEQGVTGGVLTMFTYVSLLVVVFWKLFKHKNNPEVGAIYLSLIAFLTVSQLNVMNVNEYLFFYLILAATSKFDL